MSSVRPWAALPAAGEAGADIAGTAEAGRCPSLVRGVGTGVLWWPHRGHTLIRRRLLSSRAPGSRDAEAPQGDASHSSLGDEAAARTIPGRAGPWPLQSPMSKALRRLLRLCPSVPPAGPCTGSVHTFQLCPASGGPGRRGCVHPPCRLSQRRCPQRLPPHRPL